MWLTTEELGDIPEVTAADVDAVLLSDAFGKFAILSASEGSYIQAASDWQPTDACQAFLQQHDSDPWLLEYRDGTSGQQFRATGHVTLEQVRRAFQSYFTGGREWQQEFVWQELQS